MRRSPRQSDVSDSSSRQVAALQREMGELKAVIEGLVRASALECILERGFYELSERLAPLRDLGPQRVSLPHADGQMLQSIRDQLKRPDWSRSARHAYWVEGESQTVHAADASVIVTSVASRRNAS